MGDSCRFVSGSGQLQIINDTWGHSAGDDFLKTIAERLTSTLRPSDLSGRLVADDDEAADDGDQLRA